MRWKFELEYLAMLQTPSYDFSYGIEEIGLGNPKFKIFVDKLNCKITSCLHISFLQHVVEGTDTI